MLLFVKITMILKVVSCGITYFEDSKWFIATDLTSFPTIPFDAVRVNIDSSTIPAIRSADLSHLTAITSFYMWSNSIGVIESGAFQGLETLLDLSFWDSQILTIESNGFSGLSQLESLRFHSNNINTIETLTFSELPELTYLSFWYNNITTIQARAFVLPIEIDHWSNRIINLHEDAFVVEARTEETVTPYTMTTSNAESTTTRTEETVTPYTMTTSNAETSTTITTTTRRSRVTSRDRYLEDNDSNSNPDYIYHDTFKEPGFVIPTFLFVLLVLAGVVVAVRCIIRSSRRDFHHVMAIRNARQQNRNLYTITMGNHNHYHLDPTGRHLGYPRPKNNAAVSVHEYESIGSTRNVYGQTKFAPSTATIYEQVQ